MTYDVTLIPGDGIGPEITAQTVKVLEATGLRFNWDEELAGSGGGRGHRHAAARRHGRKHPEERARLKGPLTTPVGTGFRSVNVGLRKEFELFANIRPARTIMPGGRFENVDIVLVRENLEGLYIGVEHFVAVGDDPRAVAESMAIVTRRAASGSCATPSSTRSSTAARRSRIVHKANILKMVSGLFLEVGAQIAEEYEGRVESNDMIVDNTAMQLVMRPEQFDVMVTTNMFGDILSDEVSGLVGGLGLAPGANIGTKAAIFEAVHGSAPDIAGKGVANPSAQMLAAAMMLDHIGELERANRIRRRHRGHHRARRHPDPRPGWDRQHRGVRRCCRQAGCLRSPAPGAGAGSGDCAGVTCAPTAGPNGSGVQKGSPAASPSPRRY